MIDVLHFLAAPFAASLVLVAVLGYFGLHVLLRGVIFVDLALAQIAALGAVVALVAGHPPGTVPSFTFSLAATLIGAAIFSWSRVRHGRVPQEALIGITYVVASAVTLLVADRAPEGAEHIKEMLSGAVLWVTWETVVKDLLAFLAVGLLHYRFRRHFLRISENPESAFERGLNVRWWDFLFYATFGLVIALAVEIGGVLMVFSFLVAPAIIALASSDRWPVRLAIAWGVGAFASFFGLLASYRWDLPSGPAVVTSLGALLVLFATWRQLRGGG